MKKNNVTDIRFHRNFKGRRRGAVSGRVLQKEGLPRLDSLADFGRALISVFWERPLHSTLEFLGIFFAAILILRVLPLLGDVVIDMVGLSVR